MTANHEQRPITDAEREAFKKLPCNLTNGEMWNVVANAILLTEQKNIELARHTAKLAKNWNGEKALNDFAMILEKEASK
jgi:hypothetical protein